MTDNALATTPTKTPDKPDARTRPPTGRTKRALDLMVHDGKTDNEAAVEVGITIQAIRLALKQPGVRKYMQEQRQVSLERICARNNHRLAQIRDAANNQPAVKAIQLLQQQLGELHAPGTGGQRQAGLVIVVQGNASIAGKPLTEHSNPVTIEHEDEP